MKAKRNGGIRAGREVQHRCSSTGVQLEPGPTGSWQHSAGAEEAAKKALTSLAFPDKAALTQWHTGKASSHRLSTAHLGHLFPPLQVSNLKDIHTIEICKCYTYTMPFFPRELVDKHLPAQHSSHRPRAVPERRVR